MDDRGNAVPHNYEQIQIAQGRYSVAGQMLPDELSLVTDVVGTSDTKLERIFDKNAILPTRTKKTVEVGKTLIKDSNDNLKVIVVEGPSSGHYLSNKPIGTLEINGEMIARDLLRGTEIDLTFELSESRDITISAYLNGTGQEFSQVFNPKERDVNPSELGGQIIDLENRITEEKEEAARNNNHTMEKGLSELQGQIQGLILEVGKVSEDSVTDEKFQLEDKKRAIAAEIYQLTSSKRADSARTSYKETRDAASKLVKEHGNDQERHHLREILAREEAFLNSNNPDMIESAEDELYTLKYQILMRAPAFLVSQFEHLIESRISMNDQEQANILIQNGRSLIDQESWEDLRIVIGRLWDLMPDVDRDSETGRMFTGIV